MVLPVAPPAAASRQSSHYPLALAYCATAFVLGLYAAASGWPLAALPATTIAAALAGLPRRRWRLALLVLALGASAALGVARYRATAYHDGPTQVGHYAGRAVAIVGVVDGEPQAAGHGENLPVSVESLSVRGRPTAARGRVLIHYTGAQQIEYGDRLSLTGTLRQPINPSGFDYRAYLARQGIHAILDFPLLRLQNRGSGNPLQALALGIRDALRKAIDGMLPRDEAALLIGILLGAPTRTLGRLTAPFITTGMIHVVAISGLKVALVAGVLSRLCAGLPIRVRWAPALLGVGLYTLISGATPSGLRSALMWMLALIAMQLGRRAYVWVSLAVVAAAMTWWNPALLWDTGFQLSVVGTAGIVAFTPWFDRRLHRLPAVLRESIAVTLAAQLATAPITAVGFGQLSLAGPIANGLLLPLLGPIMALGGAAAITASIIPALGHLLAFVVYPFLALFIGVVQLLSRVPLASVAPPALPLAGSLSYYLLLVVLARRQERSALTVPTVLPRLGVLWRAVPRGFLAGCLVTCLTATVALARPSGQTRLVLAGVGGDTAALLLIPDGGTALFDGGQDPAKLQVLLGEHLPFWQRDLSVVVVSEPDIHHVSGLRGITSLYAVKRNLDPGAIYPSVTYARWRAELRDAGVGVTMAIAGRRIDFGGNTRIDVLLPAVLGLDNVPAPVAYRVQVGHLAVLVVNREALLADPAVLRADGRCLDALVLPTRADPAAAAVLVDALQPRLVVLPQATGTMRALRLKLPAGTRAWTAAEGAELPLGSSDGYC